MTNRSDLLKLIRPSTPPLPSSRRAGHKLVKTLDLLVCFWWSNPQGLRMYSNFTSKAPFGLSIILLT